MATSNYSVGQPQGATIDTDMMGSTVANARRITDHHAMKGNGANGAAGTHENHEGMVPTRGDILDSGITQQNSDLPTLASGA